MMRIAFRRIGKNYNFYGTRRNFSSGSNEPGVFGGLFVGISFCACVCIVLEDVVFPIRDFLINPTNKWKKKYH